MTDKKVKQVLNEEVAESSKLIIDPNKLRLEQGFDDLGGVKQHLGKPQVRKPGQHSFFQTHPEEGYRLPTALLELKEERSEFYFVDPALWEVCGGDLRHIMLFTAIDRFGTLFLWPCKLPGPDGRTNSWNESALRAAELAQATWIRIQANSAAQEYNIYEATGNLPDPEWPEHSFVEIFNAAVKDRYIDDLDHDVLRRLRGEV